MNRLPRASARHQTRSQAAIAPLALAFGLAIVAATFGQCSGNREGPRLDAAPAHRGNAAHAEVAAAEQPAQDPQPTALVPPPDAIRLLISGSMLGRLEPCGCASGQLGGLARRMQHIGEQRTYDLLLEGGDLVAGNTELDKLKLFTAAQVLFTMQRSYDAVGVGPLDLTLPLEEWSGFLLGAPAVATNLSSSDENWPAQALRAKRVRDYDVRIGSLLLGELPAEQRGDDAKVRRLDPVQAWAEAFAGIDDGVVRIVMLHGNDVQIREVLSRLDPRPDLAIGVDPGYIEPDSAARIVHGVPLVFAGIRGRVLLDARFWREGDTPRVVCERVPLTGSRTVPGGGGDPTVKDVLLMHRQNVAEMDVLAQMAEQHPTPNGHNYVGTATCAGCHPSAMAAWSRSKHAHAWQTLVDAEKDPKRYGWPVTKYPDCVSCHVVGYGQQSGFRSPEQTPALLGVGCEQCHGPGSAHVQSMGKQKLGIVGGMLPSEMCTRCHDFEQSPEFVYGERWQLIQHGREPK